MDHNNENDEKQKRTDEDLMEEGEFGPEAFEDTEEETSPAAPATSAAPAAVRQSKLPWFLFAASVVAIGAILFIGKPGLGGTAATVNGEKVTKEELYQEMYKQGGEATLDNLITERLIEQKAKEKNIQITDQDIDAELAQIKKNFPSDEEFNGALAQNKMTIDSLKDQIRTQLKVTKLYEGQMDLTETKQKEYFNTNKDRYGTPEQIEVSHILVEKKADADKLLADLKAGADFAATAKEKSADTESAAQGGSLGFVSRGKGLDQAFEAAAFKLNKGEMSGVVESSFGFHIIKVTDKKEAVAANYDEKKDQVRKDMVNEELQTKGAEWMEGLKKEAKIEKPEASPAPAA